MASLRARRFYRDSTVTLVAIERVEIFRAGTDRRGQVLGSAEPVAVVISDPDGQRAVTMDATAADLDRLRQEVPGLEAAITA